MRMCRLRHCYKGADGHDRYAQSTSRKSGRLIISWEEKRGDGLNGESNKGFDRKPQTPTSPGIESSCAKDGIEVRLERRVRFEVVLPRWHGLESLAHSDCGGARICRDERVNLGGEVWLLVIVSPTWLTTRTWTHGGGLGVYGPG
jgi:hypothetical protein